MSTPNRPKKLSTHLELLRANSVKSYEERPDGTIALEFFPSAVIRSVYAVEGDESRGRAPSKRPERPPHREPKDAVEIAIKGIDYDPNESEADGHEAEA